MIVPTAIFTIAGAGLLWVASADGNIAAGLLGGIYILVAADCGKLALDLWRGRRAPKTKE